MKLRKDEQRWIFDYIIRTTGKTAHFEHDAGFDRLPAEARTWRMIPKALNKVAIRQEDIAGKAEEAGHFLTAGVAYAKAAETYRQAQHVIIEDDNAEKIRLYGKMLSCYEKFIKYNDNPIEKVEIPWEGKSIAALLHLLPDRRKAPCVIYVPGMDNTKEGFLKRYGETFPQPNLFVQRGMHAIAIDGPGQGESNLRKIRATPDNYERAGKAVIDYLMTRPEIDADKIAVYGLSMGSYWAPRIAAYDSRIKACVAGVACFFMNRHTIFEEASPRFKMTFMYMAGIEDEDEFDKMVQDMTLKGLGARIKCPTLLMTGEFDPLSPVEEARAFFNEIAGPKELWVLEDAHHSSWSKNLCGIPVHLVVADWLKDKLVDGNYSTDMAGEVAISVNGNGPYR